MREMPAVRRNARRKASAGQLYNLGAALAAAAAIRVISDGAFDWIIVAWLFTAAVLIISGHGLLGLLEEDEA